jgi:hypothetical protein
MSKIKLNLRVTVPEKIQTGRQLVAAMTNNPNFGTPNPPLAEITAALSALDDTYKAHQIAKADVRAKASAEDDAELKVDRSLRQLAAYVESVAGTDETLIASAGMATKAARTSPSFLLAPQALSATAGDHEGEIDLTWKKVGNAKSYIVQSSLDPPTGDSWSHAETVTTANKTIRSLTSGKRYWFRVAAVGSLGQSGWSEPATRIAP